MNTRYFYIYKIDGNRLVRYVSNIDGECKLDKEKTDYVITSTERSEANALFDQLVMLKRPENPITELTHDAGSLKETIVVVDCNGIFSEEKVERANKILKNGFSLTFDKTTVNFVMSEKSGSMSRTSRICFIDLKYKDNLENRIMLDINLPNVILSKYLAYRGLMLSSGMRMGNKDFVLNESTVIVVNDVYSESCEAPYVTASNKDTKRSYILEESKSGTHNVSLFDGEGLIDTQYADIISNAICENGKNKYNSFQVRMPFVKGMLHRVDFNIFNEEKLGGKTFIFDMFNVKHKIDDVKIILTKSMFKCADWMSGCKIMKKYFSKFKEYAHAMYITNFDSVSPNELKYSGIYNAVFENKQKFLKLNYQVLNTLDMNREEFLEIVNPPLEWRKKLLKDEEAQLRYFANMIKNEKENTASNGFENSEEPSEGEDESTATSEDYEMARAICKNPKMLKTLRAKNYIKTLADSILTDTANGKIPVSGEIRFLSGDLLYLVFCIANRDKDDQKKINGTLPQDESLRKYQFYAPRFAPEDQKNQSYAIFRNPHLSRGEHLMLQYHSPKKNSLRQKYFGHLTKVVMINPTSLAAERLSGADYDGDICGIVKNSTYNKCVDRNYYKKGGEGYKEGINRYSAENCKYPLILIPKCTQIFGNPTDSKKILECILNTFSNRIGQLSNAAYRWSGIAYYGADKNKLSEDSKKKIERAEENIKLISILTGLEIDAAKNGVHPEIPENLIFMVDGISKDTKSNKALTRSYYSRSYYIDFKNNINKYSSTKKYSICDVSENEKRRMTILDSKTDNGFLTNLECLPHIYITEKFPALVDNKNESENKTEDKEEKVETINGDNEGYLYTFEKPNWKKSLDESLLIKMAGIMLAYKDICEIASYYNIDTEHSIKEYMEHIKSIAHRQYDEIPYSENLTRTFYEEIIETISRSETTDDINSSINKLFDDNWQLCLKDDRLIELEKIAGKNLINNEKYSEYITNFRYKGFNLLYLMLKAAGYRAQQYKMSSSSTDDVKYYMTQYEERKARLENQLARFPDITKEITAGIVNNLFDKIVLLHMESKSNSGFSEDKYKSILNQFANDPKHEYLKSCVKDYVNAVRDILSPAVLFGKLVYRTPKKQPEQISQPTDIKTKFDEINKTRKAEFEDMMKIFLEDKKCSNNAFMNRIHKHLHKKFENNIDFKDIKKTFEYSYALKDYDTSTMKFIWSVYYKEICGLVSVPTEVLKND